MMNLDETTRGIWYCLVIPHKQDFLLTLNHLGKEHYAITYRFRYYNSDDPFDEEDKKSWYRGELVGKSEKEVIEIIKGILTSLVSLAGNETDFVELLRDDRSFEEFMEEFMEQDFVHARKLH